jgi:hypothetical protein
MNDFIYNRLKDEIISIDAIIKENNANKTESQLYD